MITNCTFSSIDQNSTPLWDTVPKLLALSAKKLRGVHYLEDIDVAFTRRGALPGEGLLALKQERYYRGGVSDWGAAVFYTDFLGRVPLDIVDFEPYTGWSTAALSRRLGLTVDELYDNFSYSDNWQLIGPSYAENPLYHRVIGDLKIQEVQNFLLDLMKHAQDNCLHSFPEPAAQARTKKWFEVENGRLRKFLHRHRDGTLVDLYADWTAAYLNQRIQLKRLSETLQLGSPVHQLLNLFLEKYSEMAAVYNEAVESSGVGLTPLNTATGELPAFVVLQKDGRLLRAPLSLQQNELLAGEYAWKLDSLSFPLDKMKDDGVIGIAGKAILLVLEARMAPHGSALALPYNGSLYMPAVHKFEEILRKRNLLQARLCPIKRIKFNFLDHFYSVKTLVRLPAHLIDAFGCEELQACELAEAAKRLVQTAKQNLDSVKSAEGRSIMRRDLCPKKKDEWDRLQYRRKELAETQRGREEASEIWQYQKQLEREMLMGEIKWILQQIQVSALDYYNSRGALIPWSIALGGEPFCQKLIEDAVVYEETCEFETTKISS